MILQEMLTKTTEFFKSKGIESAKLDAELLIGDLLKLSRMELYLHFERPLLDEEVVKARDLVKRRITGEPVAYILGYKDFYKSRFKVNSNVLVPRPETEHIVDEALEAAKKFIEKNTDGVEVNSPTQAMPFRIIDMGTGSGCIGLSLLKEIPGAELLAIDLSASALGVAQENATSLELIDHAQFLEKSASDLMPSDLPKSWQGQCDLVVANPPYISKDDGELDKNVLDHEPHMALFSDGEGLDLFKEWSERACALLAKEGSFISEIGFDQGPLAKAHLESIDGFDQIEIKKDYASNDRVAIAKKVKEWTQ